MHNIIPPTSITFWVLAFGTRFFITMINNVMFNHMTIFTTCDKLLTEYHFVYWDVIIINDFSRTHYIKKFSKLLILRKIITKSKSYPTVTSNMLEPTDDDTAMSPLPCFATKTLVIKSGTDVPAAKNVNPMT